MNYSIVILSLILFTLMGCADKVDSGKSTTGCCRPIFSISFHPESRSGSVTITETKDAVTVEMDGPDRVISGSSEYQALKRLILTSPEWRENVETPYYSGPWSGPPRDILIIANKNTGVFFQGDSVPSEWKRRIMKLAR